MLHIHMTGRFLTSRQIFGNQCLLFLTLKKVQSHALVGAIQGRGLITNLQLYGGGLFEGRTYLREGLICEGLNLFV